MKLVIALYLLLITGSSPAAVNLLEHNSPSSLIDTTQSDDHPSNENDRLDLINQLHLKSRRQLKSSPRVPGKAIICDRCHASSMHSSNSFLPVLQGQNLEYLFAKILLFKQDDRSFHPLQSISQGLSIDEAMDLSLYYASQSSDLEKSLLVSDFPQVQRDIENQQSMSHCLECHGADGNGLQSIPVISGQNENYLGYRIREISRGDSKVHIDSAGSVSCEIDKVDLSGSKRLARMLAMVLDPRRVNRGKEIYHQDCARCHDHGDQGAPKISDRQDWSQRIRQGTRELVKNTVIGKSNMPLWGGNSQLSRNQLKDAIHFMLYQASRP